MEISGSKGSSPPETSVYLLSTEILMPTLQETKKLPSNFRLAFWHSTKPPAGMSTLLAFWCTAVIVPLASTTTAIQVEKFSRVPQSRVISKRVPSPLLLGQRLTTTCSTASTCWPSAFWRMAVMSVEKLSTENSPEGATTSAAFSGA